VRDFMAGDVSYQQTLEALNDTDAREFVEEDCVTIFEDVRTIYTLFINFSRNDSRT
jgi:hypothetical protein